MRKKRKKEEQKKDMKKNEIPEQEAQKEMRKLVPLIMLILFTVDFLELDLMMTCIKIFSIKLNKNNDIFDTN